MTDTAKAEDAAKARLARLRGYLEADPDNLSLIRDAAETAYAAGDLGQAEALVEAYGARAAPPPGLLNLGGLIALGRQAPDAAAARFEAALVAGGPDPAIAFNLAWARARLGDTSGALAALDDMGDTTTAAAATLRVQMLHSLGRLEDALTEGAAAAARFPGDAGLMGALAVAAIDHGDPVLAARYAQGGGETPDALSVLGALDLEAGRPDLAGRRLDRALAVAPHHARSLLGKGLQLMMQRRPAEAAPYLDAGAGVFARHLGSWVAAGWAHFLAGDLAASRERFEKAVAIDDRFGEAQGGLAVIDLAEGQVEAGRRRAAVAIRLDRNCLSGALAQMMLLEQQGQGDAAARIRDLALNRPLAPGGPTLAEAVAKLGGRAR